MSETNAGALGRAVELVTFARARPTGATRVWRYAMADHDVSLAGLTYRAAILTRDAVRRGDGGAKGEIALRTTLDLPCLGEWRSESGGALSGMGEFPTTVTVLRAYVSTPGDGSAPAAASAPMALFLGELAGIEYEGNEATLTCTALAARLERAVPVVPIGRQCPHTLYDERCGVDRADHAWTGTIAARGTDGGGPTLTVTMAAGSAPETPFGDPDPQRFDGGTLATTPTSGADAGRQTARVGIGAARWTTWPTVTVRLVRDDPAFVVGAAVTLWAGCDRYFPTCRLRFQNGRRFGGFPSIPDRDPMVDGLN